MPPSGPLTVQHDGGFDSNPCQSSPYAGRARRRPITAATVNSRARRAFIDARLILRPGLANFGHDFARPARPDPTSLERPDSRCDDPAHTAPNGASPEVVKPCPDGQYPARQTPPRRITHGRGLPAHHEASVPPAP